MNSWIFIVIVGILCNVAASETSKPLESHDIAHGYCMTPNNQTGYCIDIRACDSLFRLLQTSATNQTHRELLRQSWCGGSPKVVLVCCAAVEIGTSTSTTTTKPTRTTSHSSTSDSNATKTLLPTRDICGQQATHPNIFGGTATGIDEFPWTVQLRYINGYYNDVSICAGTLINENHVVTAAHCVDREKLLYAKLKLKKIRLGEWDTTTTEDCDWAGICANPHIDVPIAQVFAHESYDSQSTSQEHDIAVIRMEQPVEFTQFIRPICLPITQALRNKEFAGVTMTAAAWGKTETSIRSDVKLKVTLDGVQNSVCVAAYRKFKSKLNQVELTEGQLCAGGKEGVDTCNGDSGGPLMAYDEDRLKAWYLAGIVSFGPSGCGSVDQPSVYVRVNQYIDWILSKMQ